MTSNERYINALAAFRRSVTSFADAARDLSRAAQEVDPKGLQPDDPAALAVFQACAQDLMALSTFIPGVRQLLAIGCGAVK